MSSKPFHLGLFLQGSSVQAWGERWTGHIGSTWMFPELFIGDGLAVDRRADPLRARLEGDVVIGLSR